LRCRAALAAQPGPQCPGVRTTQEPPGTGFNIELKTIPLDGRIVLLPPDKENAPANAGDERSNKDR